MADNYKILSGGPAVLTPTQNQDILTKEALLDRKFLNIKLREYLIFFGAILIATILNSIFRARLYQASIELILDLQTQGRDPYLLAFF